MIHIRCPLIFQLGIILHLTWAVLLWFEPSLAFITALYIFHLPPSLLSLFMIICSLSALLPFYMPLSRQYTVLALTPQLICCIMSALGAMLAAYRGTYGDGVIHPRVFIFGDQWTIALIAYFHARAMIAIGGINR